jgi:hypothetical protein
MNAASRELFRIALLRVLDANETRWGLAALALAVHVGQYGFTPEKNDVEREMQYLQDKGFADVPSKAVSPENKTWRITATGRDFLATNT